tara:strand:- start:1834 stop:2853 length:1020 start_codon:yes stop_codon:yes gene_type:complete
MKKLFIISNESIYENDNKYFCDNLDLKTTPEELNRNFDVNLIARRSLKERAHNINIKNIKIFNSFLSFIIAIIRSTKKKDSKYLIISLSPYTFLACILLKLFGKTPIVYLRSDGHEEYKAILGFIGPAFYYLMFSISSSISKLISCRNYILKGRKGEVVSPSQLDSEWLSNIKETNIESLKLLYVGRIKVEKGIFSLLKLIKGKNDISLTIVGAENNMTNNINQSNVVVRQIENNKTNLINIYDDHSVFVLPSFTEGHPMALLEALARRRPVVIFEEIKHVIGDKKGIFVSRRNYESFLETINYIKNNYQKIQEEMKQNQLPTKKQFISELTSHISLQN